MGKRFTDTEKWKDPWFRKLSPKLKSFWQFITDNCDVAGVWKVDMDLAGFLIGNSYTEEEVLTAINNEKERIRVIAKGRWFVCEFVKYQYGKLSDKCQPHIPVLNLLKSYGLNPSNVDQNENFNARTYLSIDTKEKLILRDGAECCYCALVLKKKDLVIEHVIPLSKSGTSDLSNMVLACAHCNSLKADFTLDVFCERQGLSIDFIKNRVSERVSKRVLDTLVEQDKEKDKEQEKGIVKGKPNLEEVRSLFQEKGCPAEAERFFDYYESNGWRVGKNPMKNWQSAVANWLRHAQVYGTQSGVQKPVKKQPKTNPDCTGCGGTGKLPDGKRCWCWS